MTMTNPNIAALAEKLTWQMRDAIAHPDCQEAFWCADGRTERAVEKRGLIAGQTYNGCRSWTPLGLAVRTHLQEKSNAK